MLVFENEVWTYYLDMKEEDLWYKEDSPDEIDFEMTSFELGYHEFVGKWLFYPPTLERAEFLCYTAVKEGLVKEAKHSKNKERGFVCCFYINVEDALTHYKFLSYFKKHGLLPKNRNGNYTNLAFKLDIETHLRMYGNSFRGTLHLKDYMDLETGKFTSNLLAEKDKQKKETEAATLVEKYLGMYHSWARSGNRASTGNLSMKKGDSLNAELIKKTMAENNKSAKQIADYLEVSESSVKSWLSKRSNPYVFNAMLIALYLKIDPEQIIISEPK